LPEGLHLAAITKREDPRDVFISRDKTLLQDLPPGIGTSSLRRQAQLLHFRGDLDMVPLRGNLDTRLRKLKTADLDGIVLALAGVRRLNLEKNITEILSTEISLPAIGQGALGIETRTGDQETERCIHFLNDPESSVAVSAERAFLKKLEGGCQVPIAAYGRTEGGLLRLDGLVGRTDGKQLIRHHLEGPEGEAEAMGTRLAEILLERGAAEILEEVYRHSSPTVEI
jgi:hydroxymethylbilane synthase